MVREVGASVSQTAPANPLPVINAAIGAIFACSNRLKSGVDQTGAGTRTSPAAAAAAMSVRQWAPRSPTAATPS